MSGRSAVDINFARTPEYPASPPAGWDDWCRAQGPLAGFCQTSMWGEINQAANAVRNYWFEVERDGVRIAGALLSHRNPELNGKSAIEWLKVRLSGSERGWLDCFEGPILGGENKADSLNQILSQVDSRASDLGIRSIRFHGAPVACDWMEDPDVLNVFRRYGYSKDLIMTALVDLSPAEEAVFGGFKRAARKGIRKCLKEGVHVAQCQTREEFIRDFRTAYYDDVDAAHNEARSLAMWDIDRGRNYRFFVAKNADGQVLATLGTYTFNGLATEIMSHRAKASFEGNLPAQDLLHWEVMRVHKAAGDRWFNLAGYSPAPANAKEAGIRSFKQKWGGRELAVSRFFRPARPRSVRIAAKLVRRLSSV